MSDLSEKGMAEFEAYIEIAKSKIKKSCDEALSDIYTNLPEWIESDSWLNFRNKIINSLMDYSNLNEWDQRKIRESILKNHYNQVVSELNKDLLSEIEILKSRISIMEKYR